MALKQFRGNCADPTRGPTGQGVSKYHGRKPTCRAYLSKQTWYATVEHPQEAWECSHCSPYHPTNGPVHSIVEAAKESRDAPRRYRQKPPQTGEDLSCGTAIEKAQRDLSLSCAGMAVVDKNPDVGWYEGPWLFQHGL
ncbi:hypothetical protein [uncultured Roseobacter sp.]|uniref:hypothetical protein n=1 Tax=uncultured Roseobacter sp. TaxID=114847 RepID=UPI0026105DB2|nr:hypothetical protein [uncultured Roseobacter sp.]